MRKTSKLISLLLVVAMLMSVFTVGIVATSAAAVETVTVVCDGEAVQAHVGDKIHYQAYMDVTGMPTATDGHVHVVDGEVLFDEDMLTVVGTAVANKPPFVAPVVGNPKNGVQGYTDSNIEEGFLFNAESNSMIDVTFEVTSAGDGTATITNKVLTLAKAENYRIKHLYISQGSPLTEEQPRFWNNVEVICDHEEEPTETPTEAETVAPATEAPTEAPADKDATVTLHGLFGQTETRSFNVGDTFAVWTYMNTKDCLDDLYSGCRRSG